MALFALLAKRCQELVNSDGLLICIEHLYVICQFTCARNALGLVVTQLLNIVHLKDVPVEESFS